MKTNFNLRAWRHQLAIAVGCMAGARAALPSRCWLRATPANRSLAAPRNSAPTSNSAAQQFPQQQNRQQQFRGQKQFSPQQMGGQQQIGGQRQTVANAKLVATPNVRSKTSAVRTARCQDVARCPGRLAARSATSRASSIAPKACLDLIK